MTTGRDVSDLLPARRPPVPLAEPDRPLLREFAEALVDRARTDRVQLTADGGLLTDLVRQVLRTGLKLEMTEHLSYEHGGITGHPSGTVATAHTRRP